MILYHASVTLGEAVYFSSITDSDIMLINTEIIKSTVNAATNAIKPTAVWSTTLKTAVATHPAVFLAITGGALVSLGTYYYAADTLKKKKKQKILIKEQGKSVTEELPDPV